MDKTFAINIYNLASKFGGRPYEYVEPRLTDPRCRISIDTVAYVYGQDNDAKNIEESQKKAKRKLSGKSSRPRGVF